MVNTVGQAMVQTSLNGLIGGDVATACDGRSFIGGDVGGSPKVSIVGWWEHAEHRVGSTERRLKTPPPSRMRRNAFGRWTRSQSQINRLNGPKFQRIAGGLRFFDFEPASLD